MKAPALLLAAWAALPLPWQPHLPSWVERWLYNPRERTGETIAAYRRGKAERAATTADTALRLAGDDPLVRFDAGTVHLAAGHRRRATALLEEAAKKAGPDLAAAASYNLGNSRLAGGDAAGAVDAYKQALRVAPGYADAKFNLELALREREKERARMRSPWEGSRGDRQGEQGESNRSGADQPADGKPGRSNANDPGKSRQSGQEPARGEAGEARNPGAPQPGTLPQFRNQPEMGAREAAALLESVENLERQQLLKQAARRAKQRAARGKDW
jgi:Ca-activated chloride channel homolog